MKLGNNITHQKTINTYNRLLKTILKGFWSYDFKDAIYEGEFKKIKLFCKEHGEFHILPHALKRGQGCAKCAHKIRHNNTKETALNRLLKACKTLLPDCSCKNMVYINKKTKVELLCKKHGSFWMLPQNIRSGSGCPSCASYGFNPKLPATVYYLKIGDGEAYKIGITNRAVENRFTKAELQNITVLKTWDYLLGSEAKLHEKVILKEFSYAKYTGRPLLVTGNTELFYYDILDLDTV